MSRNYPSIAFTQPVLSSQVEYGSRAALDRVSRHLHCPGSVDEHDTGPDPGPSATLRDPLGADERDFISQQDGFYLATVSETGWPYVQFRGGAPGFVQSPDEHTVAWADFRGNRQYISTGNLHQDGRVALIFLDYARQLRLKVFGVATVTDVRGQAPYAGSLSVPGYRAIVEREVRVSVSAFDWNCPQHITPRFTVEELEPVIEPVRRRVGELESENERLRRLLAAAVRPANGQSKLPPTPLEDMP